MRPLAGVKTSCFSFQQGLLREPWGSWDHASKTGQSQKQTQTHLCFQNLHSWYVGKLHSALLLSNLSQLRFQVITETLCFSKRLQACPHYIYAPLMMTGRKNRMEKNLFSKSHLQHMTDLAKNVFSHLRLFIFIQKVQKFNQEVRLMWTLLILWIGRRQWRQLGINDIISVFKSRNLISRNFSRLKYFHCINSLKSRAWKHKKD